MTVDVPSLEAELKRDPGSRQFAELAREYQRLGRMEEAKSLCESGLQKNPTQWQARLLLAQIYMAEGRLVDARSCVERILLALPEHVAANHLAGDLHFALDDRAKALKHYQVVELFEPGRQGVARAIADLSAPALAVLEETAPVLAPPLSPTVAATVATPATAPFAEAVAAGAPETPASNPAVAPEVDLAVATSKPEILIREASEPDEELLGELFREDFVGTIKIPAWSDEPGTVTPPEEDVDETAPSAVLAAREDPFGDLGGRGEEPDLGEDLLEAHEQTLTNLPKAAGQEMVAVPAVSQGITGPEIPAVGAESPALSTGTLAALYAEQGYPEKAVEVYQRLLLQDPERADVKRKIQDLMLRISGEAPEMPDVQQEDVRRALRQRRVQVLEGWLRRVREDRHV